MLSLRVFFGGCVFFISLLCYIYSSAYGDSGAMHILLPCGLQMCVSSGRYPIASVDNLWFMNNFIASILPNLANWQLCQDQ